MKNYRALFVLSVAGAANLTALAGAVDTLTGVSGIAPSSSLLKDMNGDGLLTDSDIVVQLYDLLGPDPEGDVDGDGSASVLDTFRAVEKLVSGSCGDVDGSGTVDISDVDQYVASLLASNLQPKDDVNTDGMYDSADLYLIYSKIGVDDTGFTNGSSAVWLTALLIRARNDVIDAYYADQSSTNLHHLEISPGWRDHEKERSNTWPPNHELDRSVLWPRWDHSRRASLVSSPPNEHAASLSVTWPANHLKRISSQWYEEHEQFLSYRRDVLQRRPGHNLEISFNQYIHSTTQSTLWGVHNESMSEFWKSTPNHRLNTSVTWTLDDNAQPILHRLAISRRWPPNHHRYDSNTQIIIPRQHLKDVSEEWMHPNGVPFHALPVSMTWPPMHHRGESATWIIGHNASLSIAWPANHHGSISSLWPHRINPGTWPSSHHPDASNQTVQPQPRGPADWPAWPQDHNWWHTIREAITLPGEIVDPFVPLVGPPAIPPP